MHYQVEKDFRGAIRGCHVRQFRAGEVTEIDDPQLVSVALEEGWIKVVASATIEAKAQAATPGNKAAKGAPRNKAAE